MCLWANRGHNYIHVEYPRSAVAFDTIRHGTALSWVRGCLYFHLRMWMTKIINRAKEEGITPQEVADKYIALSWDVTALGIEGRARHPRVGGVYGPDIIRFGGRLD